MCSSDYHSSSCYTVGQPSMPSFDSVSASYSSVPSRAFYSSRETASDSNNS